MAITAMLLFATGTQAASPPDEKQVDHYLQSFYESALWNDGRWPVWIRRWDKPIRVRLTGPMASSYTDMVMQKLNRMAALAGVKVTVLGPEDRTENLRVEFLETNQLYAGGRAAGCIAHVNGGSTITSVRLQINLAMGFGLRHCIVHELMHAMGFLGHPHDIDTVLSYRYQREDLTEIDKILLKTMYDARVKPGMYQLSAMPVVREVVTDHLVAAGAPEATRAMGQAYLKRLIPAITDMAEKGNVGLQYQVGVAYTFGQAVPQDIDTGLHWLKRAADSAQPNWRYWTTQGQFMVGEALWRGRGVPANPVEAANWYRRAAEQGHVTAQNMLGLAYRDGMGVDQDAIEAYKWLSLAAQQVRTAATSLELISAALTPDQIDEAKRRIANWKPSTPQ